MPAIVGFVLRDLLERIVQFDLRIESSVGDHLDHSLPVPERLVDAEFGGTI
jgi:hypothetical protein